MKSSASRLFTQTFIRAFIKESIKAQRRWPLWEEFTGDRWIPRTKGGKCFHLMTSSWLWLNWPCWLELHFLLYMHIIQYSLTAYFYKGAMRVTSLSNITFILTAIASVCLFISKYAPPLKSWSWQRYDKAISGWVRNFKIHGIWELVMLQNFYAIPADHTI